MEKRENKIDYIINKLVKRYKFKPQKICFSVKIYIS